MPVKVSLSDLNSTKKILVDNVRIDVLKKYIYEYNKYIIHITDIYLQLTRLPWWLTRHVATQKKHVFPYNILYVDVYSSLFIIERIFLTRTTSFPENHLCHGIKWVTEGRQCFFL